MDFPDLSALSLPDTIPSLMRPLWTLSLQSASWQGVSFVVTATEPVDGRRVVVHEYPNRDLPYVEDLGPSNCLIPLKAFLVGDDVIQQRDKLKKVCRETIGPGTLIHPSLGLIRDAVLISASFGEQVEDGRMISLSLVFMRSLPPVYPGGGDATADPADMQHSAWQDFVKSATSIATKVAGVVGTVARYASLALAAVSIARAALGAATGMGNSLGGGTSIGRYSGRLTTPNPALSGIATRPVADYLLAGTQASLAALTRNRAATGAAGDTMLAAAATPAVDTSFVNSVFAVTESLRVTLIDPAEQIRALTPLCSFAAPPALPGTSPIVVGTNLMQTATAALCRRSALTSLAAACGEYRPNSSTATQAILDQILPIFDAEILTAADSGDLNSYRDLHTLKTATAADLQKRGSQLPALIAITRPVPQPSLAVAWALYQDANRSDDLIARADPVNPCFMPVAFTALSA